MRNQRGEATTSPPLNQPVEGLSGAMVEIVNTHGFAVIVLPDDAPLELTGVLFIREKGLGESIKIVQGILIKLNPSDD